MCILESHKTNHRAKNDVWNSGILCGINASIYRGGEKNSVQYIYAYLCIENSWKNRGIELRTVTASSSILVVWKNLELYEKQQQKTNSETSDAKDIWFNLAPRYKL